MHFIKMHAYARSRRLSWPETPDLALVRSAGRSGPRVYESFEVNRVDPQVFTPPEAVRVLLGP